MVLVVLYTNYHILDFLLMERRLEILRVLRLLVVMKGI